MSATSGAPRAGTNAARAIATEIPITIVLRDLVKWQGRTWRVTDIPARPIGSDPVTIELHGTTVFEAAPPRRRVYARDLQAAQ